MKTPITRAELNAKVLEAIREHPACRDVAEIAITSVEVLGQGSTWHVNVVDSGFSPLEISMTVARDVAERMQPIYELIDAPAHHGSNEQGSSNA
ncbi:MAG: hypothetical protein JO134_20700 [Xanthobacteraceae bacterium]|nr:hypothetical protein [Xanthobacteraceae bacterium]MBV9457379.1 hypothetical protein [Bradyrhizobium sp.]